MPQHILARLAPIVVLLAACASPPPPTVALLPTNPPPMATTAATALPPTEAPSTPTPNPPTPVPVPSATPTSPATPSPVPQVIPPTLAVDVAPKNDKDRAAIEKVIDDYRKGLIARNGPAVVKLIDRDTLSYYDELVRLALSSSKVELGAQDLSTRFVVLRIRSEFTLAQLKKQDGKGMFIEGVNRGWTGRSSAESIALGEARISGARATASFKAAPNLFLLPLVYEDGGWKLRISNLMRFAEQTVQSQRAESGLDEDAFLERMLGVVSEKSIDRRIFDGPLTELQREPVRTSGVFTTTDGLLRVTAGTGWRTSAAATNEDASLIINRDSGDAFLMIVPDDPADFDSFEAYLGIVRDSYTQRIQNLRMSPPVATKLGPLAAQQFTVTGSVQGIRLTYLITAVEGNAAYYQVLAWASQSRYAQYEQEFKRVVGTIRET